MVKIRIWIAIVVSTAVLGVVFKFPSSINDSTHVNKLLKPFFKYSSDPQIYLTSKHCTYPFYIFIYPLPTIFNIQVLPYIEFIAQRSAGFLTNHSRSRSLIFDGAISLTQFNTEILIHWLLTKHPCVTPDPGKASFFYLPVYAHYMHRVDLVRRSKTFSEPLQLLNKMLRNPSNVDAFYRYADRQTMLDRQAMLQFQNRSTAAPHNISQLYPDLPATKYSQFHLLPSSFKSYLYRNQLCDHIFVASRPFYSWDGPYIWQAGADRGLQHNIIWLAIEASPRYPLDRYTLPKFTKNIAIPYVVSGELHEAGDLIYRELQSRLVTAGIEKKNIEPCRVFCSKTFSETFIREHLNGGYNNSFERPLLGYFAGSYRSFRTHLYDLLSTMQASVFEVISRRDKKKSIQRIMYLKSTFCFVLPGDSYSSKRLFDVIAGNCIPVIISDRWELPFTHLPWNMFSLRFSKADLIHNKSIIRSALTSMPVEQILGMQINLYKNRNHFLYALDTQKYITQADDALDNIFQELSMRQQYAKTCQYYG
jgi:hypothetical protein